MDKSNLIVNYLQTNVNEEDLNRLFSDFGQIQSLKIVRDKGTCISMGFGFVNFDCNESANRAAEALNGMELHGKRIKVSVARPAWKANIHSNLYIANLPTGCSEDEVYELVGPELAAHIEHVRMLKNTDTAKENRDLAPTSSPTDVFRGVAVARFDTEESACAGLELLNTITVESPHNPSIKSQVHAKPWRPEFRPERAGGYATNKPPSSRPPPPPRRQSLDELVTMDPHPSGYMKAPHHRGMPPFMPYNAHPWARAPGCTPMSNTEESILQSTFEQFGAYPGTMQMYADKSWGYVQFPNAQAAYAAVNSLTGFHVSGKILELEAAGLGGGYAPF
jgi:hypothetical protein